MKYPTNRLIIWRSLVQAQAGPRFYYSDLRFGVGRCFWFLRKQCVNKRLSGKVYAVIFYETPHHSIRCYIVSCFKVWFCFIPINFLLKHDTLSCKSLTFVHHIERKWLRHNLIQFIAAMPFPICNMDLCKNASTKIQQCVHFDCAFAILAQCPCSQDNAC